MKENKMFTIGLCKVIVAMCAVLLLLPGTKLYVRAEVLSGYCGTDEDGKNVSWTIEDGVLTLSGEGEFVTGRYSNENDICLFWTYDSDTPIYSKTITKIIINEGITAIPESAFPEFANLQEVVLPDTITVIGSFAFRECSKLKSITIPENVKKVEWGAFSQCKKMESVVFKGDGYIVDEVAFWGCKKLTEVNLSGAKEIVYGAFRDCENLEEVILPDDITKIYGFDYCTKLSSIQIPSTVTEIGDNAFSGCSSLKNITIPNSVTVIGSNAFCGCENFEYNLPDGIKSIGNGAFMYCRCNKEVILPETLESLGKEAFSVERLVLPKNLKNLPENAFNSEMIVYCTNEEQVEYCKEYVDYRYIDVTNKVDIVNADVKIIPEEVTYTGKPIVPGMEVIYKNQNKDIVLKEGFDYEVECSENINPGTANMKVKGKGYWVGEVGKPFDIYGDIGSCEVVLTSNRELYDGSAIEPKVSVKSNGNLLTQGVDYVVKYNNNIEAGLGIVIISGIGNYKGDSYKTFEIFKNDIAGAQIELSYSEIICDGSAKEPEVTVTYDGRKLVKDKEYTLSFSDNVLPGYATVKITGISQFTGSLEKQFEMKGISIEDAEVLLKESIYSYDGSPKTPPLEVKLNGKTLIKDTDYAVTYENNISDGTAHAVVTGKGIYIDIVKTSFVILPYNAGMDAVYPEGTMIDGSFVYGVTDDETNEVEVFCPASKSISKLQIPATITDENGIIYNVTSIGNKAFYKNTKITSVTIGNNVKSIEDYAFYGCKNIKTLKIGKNVEIMGNSAFRKCTKLTSVTLPKTMDSLGKNCFYGCSKLKTITINANSVVDVKANAIKGISKKAVIKVPKKLVKKYKKEFDKKSGFKSGMKIRKK